MTRNAHESVMAYVMVLSPDENQCLSLVAALSEAEHEVLGCATMADIREALEGRAPDIVVCELDSAPDDGVAWLDWLISRSPTTPIIAIGSHLPRGMRARYLATPIIHWVDAPYEIGALLERISALGVRRGFFGNSIEIELFDYVQMMAIGAADRKLWVWTSAGLGTLWFSHGDIVHVEYRGIEGEDAFYALVAQGRGNFGEFPFSAPPKISVIRSSTHLLMEAVRRTDEASAGLSQEPDGGPTKHQVTPEFSAEAGGDDSGFVELGDVELGDESSASSHAAGVPLEDADDLITTPFGVEREADERHGHGPAPGSTEPSAASDLFSELQAMDTSTSLFADESTSSAVLDHFFAYEGVTGAAVLSRAGAVLAEELRGEAGAIDAARSLLQGAARTARILRYNVFDVMTVQRRDGSHLVLVSMGSAMALVMVASDSDPDALRDQLLGVAA